MSKSIFYTYKYVWEDGTPYYVGKGQKNRAFADHGEIPVPEDRNRIIFLIEDVTEKEALEHESKMIKFYGRKDLGTGSLLNRTSGGQGVSGRIINEEERERRREVGKVNYEKGVGIHGRSKEQMSENGKKSGKIGGKSCYEKGVGIHGRSKEQMSENGKKSGTKCKENKTGLFGQSSEKMSEDSRKGGKIGGRKGGKIGGKTTSSQKWQCTETGYTSHAAGLTHYQKARGIDTSKRIKVDGPKIWEITFECGKVITTNCLKTWANKNGHNYRTVLDVRRGKNRNHRGIIKVVLLV
jgi:hypothetical protein